MTSQIQTIRDTLLTLQSQFPTVGIGHYDVMQKKAPYIVWAEDSESSSVEGDNYKVNQAIEGTIDLFTKTEYDPLIDAIQEALKEARISFYLNSVQYEDETQYIHYEWVWCV